LVESTAMPTGPSGAEASWTGIAPPPAPDVAVVPLACPPLPPEPALPPAPVVAVVAVVPLPAPPAPVVALLLVLVAAPPVPVAVVLPALVAASSPSFTPPPQAPAQNAADAKPRTASARESMGQCSPPEDGAGDAPRPEPGRGPDQGVSGTDGRQAGIRSATPLAPQITAILWLARDVLKG
jgi:hypothetical protein